MCQKVVKVYPSRPALRYENEEKYDINLKIAKLNTREKFRNLKIAKLNTREM